jgi:hypothetical protein
VYTKEGYFWRIPVPRLPRACPDTTNKVARRASKFDRGTELGGQDQSLQYWTDDFSLLVFGYEIRKDDHGYYPEECQKDLCTFATVLGNTEIYGESAEPRLPLK